MSRENPEGWRRFLTLCRQTDSLDQLEALFEVLLTPEERASMSLRVELIRELLRGEKTQREIAREMKISLMKITRGSNALKSAEPALKQYLLDSLS